MSKSVKNLNPHEKELVLSTLYEAAKQFDGVNPVTDFVNELLTESEKVIIGRRILIAQMILSGSSQIEIRSKLNISPNTFTKTKKWLLGQIPEYDKAVKSYEARLKSRISKNKSGKKHYDPLTFKGMREKFPMHFLFFNLAEEILSKLNK